MEEEILEARQLGEGMSTSLGPVEKMWEGLGEDLAALNDRVMEAQGAAMRYGATRDEIAALGRKDAKRIEQEINRFINDAETARKKFDANYDTPKKRIKLAFEEGMEAAKALHAAYKGRRVEAEDEEKAAARAVLEETYLSFMEGSGMAELAAAVPFDRLADPKWWGLSANPKKAEADLLTAASAVVDDWRRMGQMQWRYPEQAKANFLRTLSIGETADLDRQMAEEADRVAAIEAERAENEAWAAQAAQGAWEEEPADQCPEPPAEAPQAAPEPVYRWVVRFEAPEWQKEAVKQFMIANGIHGTIGTEAPDVERAR